MKDKISIMVWEALQFLQEISGERSSFIKNFNTIIREVFVRNIIISIDDIRFSPLDLQSLYILTPMFENQVWEFLKPKKGEVFIDIGAHIGKYAVRVARIVGEKGLVIAVEPNRSNYKGLVRNSTLNRLTNIITLNIAAWNADSQLKMFIAEKSGDHSIIMDYGKGYVEVEGKIMDRVLENLNVKHVEWIKIDTEAAEYEVINGLECTIKKYNPKIIGEFRDEKAIKLLKKLGYKTTSIPNLCPYFFCER